VPGPAPATDFMSSTSARRGGNGAANESPPKSSGASDPTARRADSARRRGAMRRRARGLSATGRRALARAARRRRSAAGGTRAASASARAADRPAQNRPTASVRGSAPPRTATRHSAVAATNASARRRRLRRPVPTPARMREMTGTIPRRASTTPRSTHSDDRKARLDPLPMAGIRHASASAARTAPSGRMSPPALRPRLRIPATSSGMGRAPRWTRDRATAHA